VDELILGEIVKSIILAEYKVLHSMKMLVLHSMKMLALNHVKHSYAHLVTCHPSLDIRTWNGR